MPGIRCLPANLCDSSRSGPLGASAMTNDGQRYNTYGSPSIMPTTAHSQLPEGNQRSTCTYDRKTVESLRIDIHSV